MAPEVRSLLLRFGVYVTKEKGYGERERGTAWLREMKQKCKWSKYVNILVAIRKLSGEKDTLSRRDKACSPRWGLIRKLLAASVFAVYGFYLLSCWRSLRLSWTLLVQMSWSSRGPGRSLGFLTTCPFQSWWTYSQTNLQELLPRWRIVKKSQASVQSRSKGLNSTDIL